jgi:hypothetical protein
MLTRCNAIHPLGSRPRRCCARLLLGSGRPRGARVSSSLGSSGPGPMWSMTHQRRLRRRLRRCFRPSRLRRCFRPSRLQRCFRPSRHPRRWFLWTASSVNGQHGMPAREPVTPVPSRVHAVLHGLRLALEPLVLTPQLTTSSVVHLFVPWTAPSARGARGHLAR